MLRTRYVVADILITEVRRTSQGIRIRIHMLTPPNKCIFFLQSLSFLFLSLHCLLPILFTYCITIYEYIRMCAIFLFFFVPCVLLFLIFSFHIPVWLQHLVRVPYASRYQVQRARMSIRFHIFMLGTMCCCMPTLWGGCTINN